MPGFTSSGSVNGIVLLLTAKCDREKMEVSYEFGAGQAKAGLGGNVGTEGRALGRHCEEAAPLCPGM